MLTRPLLPLLFVVFLFSEAVAQRQTAHGIPRATASVEQEAQEQLNRFWSDKVTSCGESVFSRSSLTGNIYEIRGFSTWLDPLSLRESDRLNGYQYRGYIRARSRVYRSADARTRNWSEWHQDSSVSDIFRTVELQKFKGSWTIVDWLSNSYGLKAVRCEEGLNPKLLGAKGTNEVSATSDEQMLHQAQELGIYFSKSRKVPTDLVHSVYKSVDKNEVPSIYLTSTGAWMVLSNSTQSFSAGLAPDLSEQIRHSAESVSLIALTPTNGWIYTYNEGGSGCTKWREKDLPPSLTAWLQSLPKCDNGGIVPALKIHSIAFGPGNSWVTLYDDTDHWNVDRGEPSHDYRCDCSKDLQQVLQGNLDNGRNLKQFIFLSGGWLLLRDDNGFAGEKIPADLETVLTEVHNQGKPLARVAVAGDGAWIITTR